MNNENAIQKRETTELAPVQPTPEVKFLSIIEMAVQSGRDASEVKELVQVFRELQSDQRRTGYYEALARIQAKLPQITRTGKIVDGKGGVRKYAKLEDLHKAIRPLLEEEGFAFSFEEKQIHMSGNTPWFAISGTLSHRGGHAETKTITVPFDRGARNDIQSRGSTQSYAHRYLIKMHLNIVERGEDTDGIPQTPITTEQAAELNRLLRDLKIDEKGFLSYMKAEKVEAILAADWQKAIRLIDSRRGK